MTLTVVSICTGSSLSVVSPSLTHTLLVNGTGATKATATYTHPVIVNSNHGAQCPVVYSAAMTAPSAASISTGTSDPIQYNAATSVFTFQGHFSNLGSFGFRLTA